MPKKSKIKLELTEEEREELLHRSRTYTLPYYTVIRAKVILMASRGVQHYGHKMRLDFVLQGEASCPLGPWIWCSSMLIARRIGVLRCRSTLQAFRGFEKADLAVRASRMLWRTKA